MKVLKKMIGEQKLLFGIFHVIIVSWYDVEFDDIAPKQWPLGMIYERVTKYSCSQVVEQFYLFESEISIVCSKNTVSFYSTYHCIHYPHNWKFESKYDKLEIKQHIFFCYSFYLVFEKMDGGMLS